MSGTSISKFIEWVSENFSIIQLEIVKSYTNFYRFDLIFLAFPGIKTANQITYVKNISNQVKFFKSDFKSRFANCHILCLILCSSNML